jgi:hypothetical protein
VEATLTTITPEAALLHRFRALVMVNAASLHEALSGRLGHVWGTRAGLGEVSASYRYPTGQPALTPRLGPAGA